MLSGKRPFAGSGAFLKQRTIPTIQDGLALGLKPVSYNPVDLFLAKYHEMSRFLMGHKTLGMMKDAGTAKLVRPGTAPPDGWTQLDDRIGTVMSTDADGQPLHPWSLLRAGARGQGLQRVCLEGPGGTLCDL